jgi:NAD dependent epimerase/dehydratase family enzyme
VLRVPAAALRLRFGQMADEAILASTRAVPEQLQRAGYRFRHPTLGEALRHVLGRHPDST